MTVGIIMKHLKNSNYVKAGWKKIKDELKTVTDLYSYDDTRKILLNRDYYKTLFGKSKNRILTKENPKLYNSIYHFTEVLKEAFVAQGSCYNNYNFKYRMIFITELNCILEKLKCQCGLRYSWTKNCRRCPDYHRTALGKRHTVKTKRKQRISALEYLGKAKGKVIPRYNIKSIPLIENYGKDHGYNFRHAENGGEYHIKELGYFLDAYDIEKNVVLEIDEKLHFNIDGKLKERDVIRQKEIEDFLGCKFIRLKYE